MIRESEEKLGKELIEQFKRLFPDYKVCLTELPVRSPKKSVTNATKLAIEVSTEGSAEAVCLLEWYIEEYLDELCSVEEIAINIKELLD